MVLEPASPCRSCVTSAWDCKWCLKQHHCSHRADCGTQQTIFNQNDQEAAKKGPNLCPYVERIEGSTLIPVGQKRALKLIGWNLKLLENEWLGYQCVLNIDKRPKKLKADIKADAEHPGMYIINCQADQFGYPADRMEQDVEVFLETASSFRIDNLRELKVTLYNCAVGQSDCSRCQVTEGMFGCVWCSGGVPACLYREFCPTHVVQTCPLPDIAEIRPLTAPIEGGIDITITGTNLGRTAADIEEGVMVGGVPCVVDPARYRASARVVCRVSASKEAISVPVKVTVRDRLSVYSTQTFTYQDPQPQSPFPSQGASRRRHSHHYQRIPFTDW
ncbi:plexin-B3-like [Scyliorhinus torazame]|uniref:plexin-B3-like n=1 Tax=Scyliorhinus torazame TaxID=75743 RepID=UPI003B593F7B